jgi:hypothetical protein
LFYFAGIALTATTDGTGIINLFYINEVANSQVYFAKQYLPNSGWGICSSTSSYFYGATAIDAITNSDGRVEVGSTSYFSSLYHTGFSL